MNICALDLFYHFLALSLSLSLSLTHTHTHTQAQTCTGSSLPPQSATSPRTAVQRTKAACPNLGPIRKGCWQLSWLKNVKLRQSASLSGLGQEAEADTVTHPAVDQGRLVLRKLGDKVHHKFSCSTLHKSQYQHLPFVPHFLAYKTHGHIFTHSFTEHLLHVRHFA